MRNKIRIFVLALSLLVAAGCFYLFRPISNAPEPADFICLQESDGTFKDFDSLPGQIYGFGLSYQQHIIQTLPAYDPDAIPPIFIKSQKSILSGDNKTVQIPSAVEMRQAMQSIEVGLDRTVFEKYPELKPLVDYEVELGMIVLENISARDLQEENFIPKLGFFIANDISERCIAILGDGKPNTYEYWGVSKNFKGFTPLPEKYWVPHTFQKDQVPCVTLVTKVNGELRQQENTSNMIYTPSQLLKYISDKYQTGFNRGDIILSGTPGGTAIHAPRWKLRIGKLLGVGRFKKLETVIHGDTDAYLAEKDEVVVSGDWLGEIKVVMK